MTDDEGDEVLVGEDVDGEDLDGEDLAGGQLDSGQLDDEDLDAEDFESEDAELDPEPGDPVEVRRIRLQAIGIVSVAIMLVAVAAVLIERRDSSPDRDFGTLEAPVNEIDLQRAELARRVRDAILELERDPDGVAAGFRSTRRGWVFGNERNDGDASLARSLIGVDEGIAGLDALLDPGDDVLVYACGESFGVFVSSAAKIADADFQWWGDNDCFAVPMWIVGQPRYFVVGDTR